MSGGRTGLGTQAHLGAPPEVLAERVAFMQASWKRTREERTAQEPAGLGAGCTLGRGGAVRRRVMEACSAMSLEELRGSTKARLWLVAMLYLGGNNADAIARAIGF